MEKNWESWKKLKSLKKFEKVWIVEITAITGHEVNWTVGEVGVVEDNHFKPPWIYCATCGLAPNRWN